MADDNCTPYAADALPLLAPFLDRFDGLDRAHVMNELGDELRFLAGDVVREAVASGATWSQVGRAFGITKQWAHERYARGGYA